MVTVEHLRKAIEICTAGGTPDHPYEQSRWGDDQCGTACCIYGHACLVAGEPVDEPSDEWSRDHPLWSLVLRQGDETIALRAGRELADTGTLSPDLLAEFARRAPWAALQFASAHLSADMLAECARREPQIALRYAAALLPADLREECERLVNKARNCKGND